MKDANLADSEVSNMTILGPSKITIFPLNGTLLMDVNSYTFDTTSINDGVYELDITAIDIVKNEVTETISFTVDHEFVEPLSVIPEEKPTSQITTLILVVTIIAAVSVIILVVKKSKKNFNNKILKEDL